MENKIGIFLKRRRESLGISLRELESKIGISDSYISIIENGKKDFVHPNILKRFSKILDVPYLYLMEMSGYLEKNITLKERGKDV